MKLTNKLLAIAALVAVIAPAGANAATFPEKYEPAADYEKSIVLDSNGSGVTTRTGACVTHNFPEKGGAEGGCAAAVVDAPNIVYFDFAKSNLNAKGKKVVDAIAEKVKSSGASKVKLSGHADRVDTEAFNQKLSERRVNTVKEALVKRGVSAGIITTEAYGETRNAVPTKDNVAEQLNRRVEVEISN